MIGPEKNWKPKSVIHSSNHLVTEKKILYSSSKDNRLDARGNNPSTNLLRPRGWFTTVSSGLTHLPGGDRRAVQTETCEDSLHIKFQMIWYILRKGCNCLRIANSLFLKANRFWNPWIKLFLTFPDSKWSCHNFLIKSGEERERVHQSSEFLCWKPPNPQTNLQINFHFSCQYKLSKTIPNYKVAAHWFLQHLFWHFKSKTEPLNPFCNTTAQGCFALSFKGNIIMFAYNPPFQRVPFLLLPPFSKRWINW